MNRQPGADPTTAKPRLVVRDGKLQSEATATDTAPVAGVLPTVAPAPPAGTGAMHLIGIEGGLRACTSRDALWQHLANEPVLLLPFGQALVLEPQRALRKARAEDDVAWRAVAVSGLATVNRDAPMLRWYEDLVRRFWRECPERVTPQTFELPRYADPEDPCTTEAAQRHLLWLPVADTGQPPTAGWLLARDTAWEEGQVRVATRLALAYAHGASAIAGRARPPRDTGRLLRRSALALALVAALLAWVPVPLTTLAPMEVTPRDPFVVAAPVAGVVERILVAPGAVVKADEPLVQLVDTSLRSDFEVAEQKLEVSRARMLRLQQAAVDDPAAKRELAVAQSEATVARAERDFARAMLDKSVIKAQQAGVALYGDPRDWVGRPVAVGEAIMRVADPARVEFELKVPVADAVNLREGAEARIFLDASPLHPVDATVVRAAYKAEPDAAGVASFVVTARAAEGTAPARLGLRGTARVYGESVSLFFYLLRRPITALRQWTGW